MSPSPSPLRFLLLPIYPFGPFQPLLVNGKDPLPSQQRLALQAQSGGARDGGEVGAVGKPPDAPEGEGGEGLLEEEGAGVRGDVGAVEGGQDA